MSRLTSRTRLVGATAIVIALTFTGLSGVAAQQGDDRWGGDVEDSGGDDADGSHLTAEIAIQVEIEGGDGGGSEGDGGQLTSQDPDWEPPACWYEPAYTPDELAALVDAVRGFWLVGEVVASIYDLFYDNEEGAYQDYNRDQQGEGMFYAKVVNPEREGDPEAELCNSWPFFVEFGEDPDDPLAVNPRIMAEYAYDRIPIPDMQFEMSPTDDQTVNLSTWLWSDEGHFSPVSAVATLPNTPYQVTTTATPSSLRLDPGTRHADLHGDCAIDLASGTFGEPWTEEKGDDAPPCGLTYRKSTAADGAYELTATMTWEVQWTDNVSGEVHELPDGAFETTVPVTVGEVQSIVR